MRGRSVGSFRGARRATRIATGIVTVAFVAGVAVSPAAVAASAKPPNLVANARFESAVAGTAQSCNSVPLSTGNWFGYAQSNVAGQGPFVAGSPVHSGTHSAEWKGFAGPSCVGGGWYQDVSFASASSYTLAAFVDPTDGTQDISLIEGWNHGSGASSVSGDGVEIGPASTTLFAWGTSAAGPALAYNAWHSVKITVDAVKHAAKLVVDGHLVAAVTGGTAPSGSATTATVYVGEASGSAGATSDFFFDDVSFTSGPFVSKLVPSSVAQGTTTSVAISGMNFDPGATVSISGSGVTVTSTAVKAASRIVVKLKAAAGAPVGARDITVTSGGATAICTGCLTVTT